MNLVDNSNNIVMLTIMLTIKLEIRSETKISHRKSSKNLLIFSNPNTTASTLPSYPNPSRVQTSTMWRTATTSNQMLRDKQDTWHTDINVPTLPQYLTQLRGEGMKKKINEKKNAEHPSLFI